MLRMVTYNAYLIFLCSKDKERKANYREQHDKVKKEKYVSFDTLPAFFQNLKHQGWQQSETSLLALLIFFLLPLAIFTFTINSRS